MFRCSPLSAFLVVSIFCLNSFAQAAAPELSAELVQATKSVFRYVPLRLGSTGERTEAKDRQAALDSTCKKPSSFLANLRCQYMRSQCSTNDICYIPFVESGSAFLVGDGQSLVSAFHVMGEGEALSFTVLGSTMATYSAEKLREIYANYSADFLLFDSDENLVYDTRNYSDPHHYEVLGDPLWAFGTTATSDILPAVVAKFSGDYGQVRLQKKLGEGLSFVNTEAVDTNAVRWAAGFPGATQRPDYNYDGFHFYLNPGIGYQWSEVTKALGVSLTPELEAYPLLLSTNDIVNGFSGGPMFDEKGRVMGIVTGTFSDENQYRGLAIVTPISALKNSALLSPNQGK